MSNLVKCETRVVRLKGEVFEYFLSSNGEKTPELLQLRLRLKQLFILQRRSILRVVAHKELAQENARIKSLPDAGINRV